MKETKQMHFIEYQIQSHVQILCTMEYVTPAWGRKCSNKIYFARKRFQVRTGKLTTTERKRWYKTYAARKRFQVLGGRKNQTASIILSAIKIEKDRTTTEVENEFENNHSLTWILCRSSSVCCRLSSDNKYLSEVTWSRSLVWCAIASNYKKKKTNKTWTYQTLFHSDSTKYDPTRRTSDRSFAW